VGNDDGSPCSNTIMVSSMRQPPTPLPRFNLWRR
jgi:hypothetical protein